jgi:TrmH RNA methyltransferase
VVYGLRAGLAALSRRPGDVLSIVCDRADRTLARALEPALRGLRAPVREVSSDELSSLSQSSHHEGLCVVTRPRRWTGPSELADLLLARKGTAVALDRVRNPYNIGAILRTAAFFGVDAALLGAPAPHPALPPDAVRVAEGGVEHLALSRTTDLADTLARLKARGVQVVGTDVEQAEDALRFPFRRPAVLVMGHEREGMSDRVGAQCDARLTIRGAGAVESLNVAVATGVLVAQLTRR